MKILMHNETNKAKVYPFMSDLIRLLQEDGHIISQIISDDTQLLPNCLPIKNKTYTQLYQIVEDNDTFISVDSFLPHLYFWYNKIYIPADKPKKRGVVIWCLSNPNIFGYSENINVYKNKIYFKSMQWEQWQAQSVVPPSDWWMPAGEIYKLINEKFNIGK